nr:uncharacterized protein LOC129268622 [Lytechinus pictus]
MSKEDLLRDSTAIFQEALHAAEKEDHLKGSERGQSVLRICKQILLILTTTTLLASVKVIIEQIYDAASAGDNARIGSFASSKMCSTFHSMRIDSEVCRVWEDLISATTLVVPLDIIRLTQQYLMRKILYIITKRRIQQDSVQTEGEATLTDHDQNVIRYVAGYIPHALVKRYRKQTSEKAKKFLSILKSWKSGQEDIEADSFLEYTCTWTNLVNRGGLFTVNDKVFKLFRAMEIKTQKTLNMNIAKNQNLKDVLCKNVSSNENVIRCWQVLCESLCSDDSEILFSSVLNYWVKIRVKAYVRVYMNILRKEEILHKKQKKLSKKGRKKFAQRFGKG